jgi:serine/threonine-protein kinase
VAAIPSQIGKYELVRRLGQGGMGSVYLARDPDLDRFVAIKVLREQLFDEELLQRFFREARASANLRHDNIITIYDVGQHDHQPYMALEYVDGQTLLEIIRSRPSLPLASKLSYIEQICAGLHFAHGAGIVHRDIKPANVMVDNRGVVRILDFGIARVEGSGMTRDGAMIGTLNYMSPEQMLGRPVNFRSDIFAVGTLAYEIITYNKAFPGSLDDGLLQKLPYEDPPPLSTFCGGLPAGLEAAVFRALAKRPEDRFGDLEQMRLAVREVRRELDPELALETVVVTARRGHPARPSSSSGRSEHPEFAERRARQIAVHLEAARAALARQDVDSAKAACEDALTLAPDNTEALALLEQTERARQMRDEESRARRERERSVRQRVADADLKLSRGDVEGAIRTLDQALAADPTNAAGLALLTRLRDAAEAAGVPLPPLLSSPEAAAVHAASARGGSDAALDDPAAARIAPTVVVPRRLPANEAAAPSADRRGKTGIVVTAAAALAIAAAGVTWLVWTAGERPAVAEQPEIAAPVPPPTVAAPTEAADAAPPVAPAGGSPEPAPAEAPRAAPTDVDAALARRIVDVTSTYRRGDLAAALNGIEPLLDTSDDRRVRDLAATLAQAAARSMSAAAAAADVLRASDRAPETYAAASRARTRAEQALEQDRYVEAGRVALAAAAGYRAAEREAAAAAAPPVTVPPRAETAATAAASTPPPGNAVTSAPSAPAVTPSAVPGASATGPVTAPNAAPPAAAPSPAVIVPRDDAGIFALMGKYQDGYRELSVDKLLEVYPRMPRERQQQLRKDFSQYRGCEVQFLSRTVSYADNDPNRATVTARSSYSCQPRTRQPLLTYSMDEIFQVEKFGNGWLIQTTGSLDAGRR